MSTATETLTEETAASRHSWTQSIKHWLATHQEKGGFVVCFPEYRPELARVLADELGLTFFDYRSECMMPYGWNASNLTLDDLDRTLDERIRGDGGMVAFNLEAMLSKKTKHERKGWLQKVLGCHWNVPVVMPVFIYDNDLPPDHSRCYTVSPQLLSEYAGSTVQ